MPDFGRGGTSCGTSNMVGSGPHEKENGADLDKLFSPEAERSVSFQENVKGADAGPAETNCIPGDELPLALFEPSLSLLSLDPSSSSGKGAECGSFAERSVTSADRVRRCLVGLRPVRGRCVEDGVIRFAETSF